MTEALGARLAAEAARAAGGGGERATRATSWPTSPTSCARRSTRSSGSPRCSRTRAPGRSNQKQAEYLEDILESGQQLLALITDLLDLAKLEAGRLPRSPQPTELVDR